MTTYPDTTNLPSITRRAAIGAIASIPAIGGATAASAAPDAGTRAGASDALHDAIRAHAAALAELDDSCNGADEIWCQQHSTKVTRAARARLNRAGVAERQALLDLCAFPASGLGDARAKAEYLLRYERPYQLDAEHTRAVLRSMIG